MSDEISPRVNSARLGSYVGRTVRLTCRAEKTSKDGESLIVQASDGGEVNVQLHRDAKITTVYIEVIGKVVDASTIKMHALIDLGDELDLKLVNDVVDLWHDPRFANIV